MSLLRAVALLLIAVEVSASLTVKRPTLRKNVVFRPLDPNNTDPREFWMPLWNDIPSEYCATPRYPIVPTPGKLAMNVLWEVVPNGTVPEVPPKPTNIWQKNLWGFQFNETDEDHWNAIYPYPYLAWPKDGNVFLMYSGAPVNLTDNRQMIVGFDSPTNVSANHPIRNATSPWMTVSAGFDLIVTFPGTYAKLHNVTTIGASVEYLDNKTNRTVAIAYFVKGSPLVSFEVFNAVVGFGNPTYPFVPPTISLNGNGPGTIATGTDFTIGTAAGPAHPQGATWHAYFSSAVTAILENPPTKGITIRQRFSGVMQVGCGEIDDAMGPTLTAAKGVFAKGVELKYDIDDADDTAVMHFNFIKGGNASKKLTMLALRHHVRLMRAGPAPPTIRDSLFWCAKGNLSIVVADTWSLKYNLTKQGFGDTLKIDPTMKDAVRQAALADYALRVDHCPGDNVTYGYEGKDNMELYAYVRDLSLMSDVAIVLEALGMREAAESMTKKVLSCMKPVLAYPNEAPHRCPVPLNNYTAYCVRNQQDLYYDLQYGGLVTNWYNRFAPHYCACDLGNPFACIGHNYCDNPYGWEALSNYGNPIYNDHHFQYGYIIKALAWAIYFQETKGAKLGMNATVLHNVTRQALVFAREVGNPTPEEDPYFTFLRHKDVFDGHSWAEGYDYSGRFVSWNNQQTGGESINAYYAIAMLGLALNDTNVRDWGRVTLATEMVSLAQYQHLSNETDDKKGQPVKQVNEWGKCISTLYGTGFSGNTYFGPNMLFECAITFVPITPITGDWISPRWAREAFEWLEEEKNKTGLCVFYDPIAHPDENPCPGNHSTNWTGNAFGCCPTNEGLHHPYVNNQWRTYPEWLPYLYILEGFYNRTDAFKRLNYTEGYYKPTKYLPFPYLYNRTEGQPTIVGTQADLTLTSALFFVATAKE